MKAVWNGRVIAESDDTVVVEGNHYFPRSVLDDDLLAPSATTTVCSWKGNRALLPPDRGRRDQPGRGLVLPVAETRRSSDRVASGILAWRGSVGLRGNSPIRFAESSQRAPASQRTSR